MPPSPAPAPEPPPETAPTTSAGTTGRRALWALMAIFLAVVLSALDISIVNTALPAMARQLGITPSQSIWVVNAYQLAVVATLLPLAALGDQLGPKRVFLGGVAVYGVASLGCALAHTLPQLVAARVLQGVGSAGIMCVNVALIRLIFPPHRLGRGVGLNALVVGVGSSLGPTVASLVLAVAPWPWLFALNVPLAVLALLLGRRTIPDQGRRAGHAVDRWAAVLNALTFATLIFGISSAAQRAPLTTVAPALLLAAVFGTLLLRRQRGHAAPLLPVDLLRRPLFALSTLTSMCSFTVQGLAFVALPFFFQTVLHRSAVETGFLLTPWAVVVALMAPLAGTLSDRYPPAVLGGVGLAVLSAGMVSVALLPVDASTPQIVWRMVLCGAGFGFFQSPNLRAMMSSAPPERASGASGMIAMARLSGQTSGAALVALCLGLGGNHGPVWAVWAGAVFAALASGLSLARLRVG